MNSRKFPYFAKIQEIVIFLALVLIIVGQTKACPSPTTTFPIQEDFETNAFVNWTHDSSDDFNWVTHTGGTTSGSTGPSSAYNGSYYAYTEATTPNNPNKIARLISPCFSVQNDYTTLLDFAYHMYGGGMGTFDVDITTNDGATWTNLWGLSGNQGNAWFTNSINLNAYAGQDVKLRFSVVTNTYQSDVAIDDVVISSISNDCNAVDISSLDGSTDAITDFNNSNVMIGDAVITIAPTTFYGTATLDEYGINDNHETGSFGLQLGVNSTGPSNYLESIYNFSQGVEFYNGRILDIDYSDAIKIYGKLNGQDVPFTITNLGSCVNYDGNNTFNSTCFSNGSPANSTLYAFDISFDGIIDQIIFQSYDPGPGDGGSFTFIVSPDPSCSVDIEICDNNLDDDGDGLIDSADPDCPIIETCSCSGANMFDNPGFETGSYVGATEFITGVNGDDLGSNWGTPSGLDGWSHGPLWWIDAPAVASEGNRLVYINNATGGSVCQGQYFDLGSSLDQLSACATYQLCFDWASFNRENPDGRIITSQPALDFTWFDDMGNTVGVTHEALGVPVGNQDWDNIIWSSISFQFSLTGTHAPPAGATEVRVNISENSGQDNGLLIDNANLCVVTSCSEICDNDIDDDGDGEIDCEDLDCGFVLDREFNNGLANWFLYNQSGNTSSLAIDATSQLSGVNSAHIDITTAAGSDWGIQLGQGGLSLETDVLYDIHFEALASANRTISVGLQLDESPYTSYFYQQVNLGTGAQSFDFQFTAAETVTGKVNLLFNLGDVSDDVWLDNIQLKEACIPLGPQEIYAEAECADVGIDFVENADATASGGNFIQYNGPSDVNNPPTTADGWIRYTAAMEAAGDYYIYARTWATTVDDDSWWVRINEGTWVKYNNIPQSTQWEWNQVWDADNGNTPVLFTFPAGINTIDFAHRETGAKLDKIFISSSATAPSGLGGTSSNCPPTFLCDSKLYQTIEVSGDYWLYELQTSPMAHVPLVNLTAGGVIGEINNTSFNKLDGYIYTINIEYPHRLYRIGGDLSVHYLGKINGIPTDAYLNAADFGPDGKIYIRSSYEADIYELDVSDLTNLTATLKCGFPIRSGQWNNVGDIAYNPIDGHYYGTRDESTVIIKYDLNTCTEDSITASQYLPFANGAFYIAADGTAYGYQNGDGNLLRIDLVTGNVDTVGTSIPTLQTDGCSCEGIKFLKDVNDICVAEGNTTTYTFTIHNNWYTPLSNINFRDTLVDGLTWASEPYHVSGGTLAASNITGNSIGNFTISSLPIGELTFKIDANIPNGYSGSQPHLSQAYLDGLPGILAPIKKSDYPATPEIDDPTPLNINTPVSVTGHDEICVGETTTLSPTSGGSWTSYDASIATVTNGGVVTAVAEGSVNFTFVNSITGCATTSSNITVSSLPNVSISGVNVICEGGATVLTSSASGGSGTCGYQWEYAPDNNHWLPISGATGHSLSIVGLVSDTYYRLGYTCSGNSGCGTSYSNSHLVAVSPDFSVDITFSGQLCLESNTQLTAVPTGGTPGYSYSWSGPSSFSSTLTTINIAESGNYYVTVTDTVGCTAQFSAYVYEAYAPFIFALNTEVCEGEDVTLSINSGSAVQYNWGANAGNATTSSVTVTPSPPSTDYSVTVTNGIGCTSVANATINVISKPTVAVTGPSSICEGETTTLSPTTGGTWISTNNAVATVSNTGVVTGVSAGTASFIFTNSTTTCESLPTTDITITAKTPVSVTGPTSICEGFTSQLSPTTGGVWTSNNPGIATVNNSGVVTAVSEGSTTFVFTNTSTGCVSDATQPITVNDVPDVSITGGTTICIGSTTTLTPVSGGTWSSSNTAVATVTNGGVVTAIATGTVTFTFTTSQGCVAGPTETLTVDSNGNITITGDDIICGGETTQLTASSGGGNWLSSNTSIATVNSSGIVTGHAAGLVTITYQHNSGSCVADPTFGMEILAQPTVNITGSATICVGENTQLATSGSGGFWTSSDPNIAIVSSAGTVVGVGAGTVSFTYTSSNGCESSASGTLTVDPSVDVSIDFNGSLCLSDDSQLSAIVVGGTSGYTYSWTGPGGFADNTQTIDIILNGNYNLTVTDSKGCSSNTTAFVYEAYEPFIFALNTEVCEGEDVTLSVNSSSSATYQWSANAGSATSQSVTVTPGLPSTTYYVTVTNSIGCSTVATAVIDVDAKPVVNITGPNSICVNGTTQLTPSSAGTWTSSDYGVATISNTGLVTGVSNGTATFTYRSDASGCFSDPSAPVTISNNGVITITGDNQICIGDNPTLTASVAGGTWSSNNIAVAQINSSGVITAISQGSATITYTPGSGNCYSNATYEINIHESPSLSINGPSTICEGDQTFLTASTSGTWTSSDPSIAAVSAIGVVTGMSAGTVTFSFVTAAGCSKTLGTPITIIGSPVISLNGPSDICINSTTSLLPSSGGVWISDNINVATVSSTGIVTGVNSGTAIFTFIEYSYGCISENTISINVNDNPTINGLDESILCIGETTNITPSSGGTWSSSNTSVATISNGGIVTAVGSGSATFIFTNSLTGCISDASMPLTVNNAPMTNFNGPTSICAGETTSISPSTGGSWTSTNVAIATITSGGIITGVSPGTVQFVFTNSSTGCASDASEDLTVGDPTVVNVTGPSNICVGETSTLSPSTGGTWESSDQNIATVSNNGIVTGVAPGSATFIFNSNTGCTSDPTSAIIIDPKPAVSFTGPSSICLGTTTTLNPTTDGSWSSSNPAVATVDNSGLVTGISTGSATFTFVHTATGCSAETQTILNVYDNPTISISGDDQICIGGTTNMLPSSGGTWVSSNSFVASITPGGVVTGMNDGVVTFTFYESGTGCVSNASDPITVLAKPVVNITGSNPICIGATTTLSPTTGGSWISSDDNVATVTNQGVVTGVAQGLVKFTFISDLGCSSDQTAPVIIYGKPSVVISGSDLLCTDETGQMLPSSGGSWSSTNPSVATINNGGVITAISAGTVRFIFTDSSTGCTSDESDEITVNDKPTISIIGPSTICIGGATNLVPTDGGTWESLDPSIATIQNNGEVLGVSAGTTRFLFTNLSTGCISDTSAYIIVDPGPAINFTGPQNLCIGETSSITPATGGSWMSTDNSVATIDNNGIITAVGQGSVKFRYTETSTGCNSELSETLIVHGDPVVSVSGSSTICVGSSTTLSPSTGGIWTSLQPAIATVDQFGNVSGVSVGIAYFKFVDDVTGCESDGSLNISVQDGIDVDVTGDTEICVGYTTTLSPSGGGFWTSSNPAIASVTNSGIVTARAPGVVTFEFVDGATGCSANAPTDPVTVTLCTNHDFNVTQVNLEIQGNLNTNDIVAAGTTYGGIISVVEKPIASIPSLIVNFDGSYTFSTDQEGKYIYSVPVCIPPLVTGCPTTYLEINVVDNVYSQSNPVANLEFSTTFTHPDPNQSGIPVNIKSVSNDDCVNTGGCDLDPSSVTVVDGATNGSCSVNALGVITYTPEAGFIGKDTIHYTICVNGAPANLTESFQVVTINDNSALNSVVASDDFNYTNKETPAIGNVMDNDSDPESHAISVTPQGSIGSPIVTSEGSYYIEADGDYSFTPVAGFSGAVEIIYTLCDNAGTPSCADATLHLLVFDDIAIKLRVYLEGALMLNGGEYSSFTGYPLMRDDLRVSPFTGENYIPASDPYTYQHDDFMNTPSMFLKMGPGLLNKNIEILDSAAVFSVTGDNAIVDWVHVELRSKDDNTVPIATRSGLVQRDGDVVDLDGVSDLRFDGLMVDSFYVAVKHRSHLGVMSQKVGFDQMVDFTDPNFPVFDYGTTYDAINDFSGLSQKADVVSGYMALWSGDFDSNGQIKFTNPSDDLNILFVDVLFSSPNFLINYNNAIGYFTGDFNMNSKAKYTNPDDDTNFLFSQVLLYPLNSNFLSNFNSIIEQIPE